MSSQQNSFLQNNTISQQNQLPKTHFLSQQNNHAFAAAAPTNLQVHAIKNPPVKIKQEAIPAPEISVHTGWFYKNVTEIAKSFTPLFGAFFAGTWAFSGKFQKNCATVSTP